MLFCYYMIIESKLDKFFGYLPNNKTHVLLVLIRNYLYIRDMFTLLIRKFKVHFLSSLLLMSSNACKGNRWNKYGNAIKNGVSTCKYN